VPDGASLKIIDVTDEFALVRMTAKGGGEGWIRIEHLRPKVGKGRVRMGKRVQGGRDVYGPNMTSTRGLRLLRVFVRSGTVAVC